MDDVFPGPADACAAEDDEGRSPSPCASPPPLELPCEVRCSQLRRSRSISIREDGLLNGGQGEAVGSWRGHAASIELRWHGGAEADCATSSDGGSTFRGAGGLHIAIAGRLPSWFRGVFDFESVVALERRASEGAAIVLHRGGLFATCEEQTDVFASSGVWSICADRLDLAWHRKPHSELVLEGRASFRSAEGDAYLAVGRAEWFAERVKEGSSCPCCAGTLSLLAQQSVEDERCWACSREAPPTKWRCASCRVHFCRADCIRKARAVSRAPPEFTAVAYRPAPAPTDPSWSDLVMFRADGTFVTRFEEQYCASSGTWHARDMALMLRWHAQDADCLVPDPSDTSGVTMCSTQGLRLRRQSSPDWFMNRFNFHAACAVDALHQASHFSMHSLPESVYFRSDGSFVVLAELKDLCSTSGTWRASRRRVRLTWRTGRTALWSSDDDGATFRSGDGAFKGGVIFTTRSAPEWFSRKFQRREKPSIEEGLVDAAPLAPWGQEDSDATVEDLGAASSPLPDASAAAAELPQEQPRRKPLRRRQSWGAGDEAGRDAPDGAIVAGCAAKRTVKRKKKTARSVREIRATLDRLGEVIEDGAAAHAVDGPAPAPEAPQRAGDAAAASDAGAVQDPETEVEAATGCGETGTTLEEPRAAAAEGVEDGAATDNCVTGATTEESRTAAPEGVDEEDAAAIDGGIARAAAAAEDACAAAIGDGVAGAAEEQAEGELARPGWLPGCGPSNAEVPPEDWGMTLRQWAGCMTACIIECDREDALSAEHQTPSELSAADARGVDVHRVIDGCVRPWTRAGGTSIALLLNAEAPRRTELFVSHASGGSAAETLEAVLTKTFAMGLALDVAIWFCAFSQHQFGHSALQFDPLRRVFGSLSAPPSTASMLLVQTSKAEVFGRLWCAVECAEALNSDLSIAPAFSMAYGDAFAGDARKRKTIKSGCSVSVRKARCARADDEALLLARIDEVLGGVRAVDDTLSDFWVGSHRRALRDMQDMAKGVAFLGKKGGHAKASRVARETVAEAAHIVGLHCLQHLAASSPRSEDDLQREILRRARRSLEAVAADVKLLIEAPALREACREGAAGAGDDDDEALRGCLRDLDRMPLAMGLLRLAGFLGLGQDPAPPAEPEAAAESERCDSPAGDGGANQLPEAGPETDWLEPPIRLQLTKKTTHTCSTSAGACRSALKDPASSAGVAGAPQRRDVAHSARGGTLHAAAAAVAAHVASVCEELGTGALASQVDDLRRRVLEGLSKDIQRDKIYEVAASEEEMCVLLVVLDKCLDKLGRGCCRAAEVHEVDVVGFVQRVHASSRPDFEKIASRLAAREPLDP